MMLAGIKTGIFIIRGFATQINIGIDFFTVQFILESTPKKNYYLLKLSFLSILEAHLALYKGV